MALHVWGMISDVSLFSLGVSLLSSSEDSEVRLQDSRGTLIGQGEGTSGLDRVFMSMIVC